MGFEAAIFLEIKVEMAYNLLGSQASVHWCLLLLLLIQMRWIIRLLVLYFPRLYLVAEVNH